MRILVFDNYDSFTYNLVHLLGKIGNHKIEVHKNDEIPMENIKVFDKVLLSPGPGVPSEAGMLLPLIREYAPSKSILGVCLGHQAIGEAFGGRLVNLSAVYHGVATPIQIKSENSTSVSPLFQDLPPVIEVGRYHSWVISDKDFPDDLEVTARDENDQIMALQHRSFDVQGVQFHPESILTAKGEVILKNWLES